MNNKKQKHKCRRMILLVVILAAFIGICGVMFIYGKSAADAEVVSDMKSAAIKKEKKHKKIKKPFYILVNKSHCLPDDYTISLVTLKNGKQVAKAMYHELRKMWFDCEKQNPGCEITVVSGYRTYSKQKKLLDEEIKKNEGLGMEPQAAEKDALRTVAPPGYSEHETGLCVDITAKNYGLLTAQQDKTPENQWLRKNCTHYGFVLRYPKGKEKVTGYQYEPWHFRYVGKKAAVLMKKNNWTLEEYWETL